MFYFHTLLKTRQVFLQRVLKAFLLCQQDLLKICTSLQYSTMVLSNSGLTGISMFLYFIILL